MTGLLLVLFTGQPFFSRGHGDDMVKIRLRIIALNTLSMARGQPYTGQENNLLDRKAKSMVSLVSELNNKAFSCTANRALPNKMSWAGLWEGWSPWSMSMSA